MRKKIQISESLFYRQSEVSLIEFEYLFSQNTFFLCKSNRHWFNGKIGTSKRKQHINTYEVLFYNLIKISNKYKMATIFDKFI